MATKEQTRKVKSAERAFMKADEALADFENQHAELIAEFDKLVEKRETARQRLITIVSQSAVAAGGMRVSRPLKLTFDGKYLYETLDPELRDGIVEMKYVVNRKAYDKAVAAGLLDDEVTNNAVLNSEVGTSVTKQIKPIRLR